MAYNQELAARVRTALARRPRVQEKPMMGGLTFMVAGKMCVGVVNDDLMARIAPEDHDTALRRKGCRPMDFTGKPMKGFVLVGPRGTASQSDLQYWIDLALAFNPRAKASRKRRNAPNAAPRRTRA